jgi:predicted RNase H-like HicB family nuclease
VADLRRLTAIIEREDYGYFALCPEYDIASQGTTIEDARENLVEALTLFFECADEAELNWRFQPEVFVTQVEAIANGIRILKRAIVAASSRCVRAPDQFSKVRIRDGPEPLPCFFRPRQLPATIGRFPLLRFRYHSSRPL